MKHLCTSLSSFAYIPKLCSCVRYLHSICRTFVLLCGNRCVNRWILLGWFIWISGNVSFRKSYICYRDVYYTPNSNSENEIYFLFDISITEELTENIMHLQVFKLCCAFIVRAKS